MSNGTQWSIIISLSLIAGSCIGIMMKIGALVDLAREHWRQP
jgi:hypothetical protein